MYIVDFFDNIVKRRNIGITIYLLLNLLLLWALFGNFFYMLILYAVSLSIALSPVGEFILRWKTGAREIKDVTVQSRLEPIFNGVYKEAKKKNPNLPGDIKLFINSDTYPNAFAVGRKTVVVTQGLLSFSDEEIKGVIAHEFAHLSNKDTDILLVIAIGNFAVTAYLVIVRLIMFIVALVMGKNGFIPLAIGLLIGLFMWLWTKIGLLLVMYSSRQNEFAADIFAHEIGYSKGLLNALTKSSRFERRLDYFAALYSTHPETSLRIAKLRELGAS